MAFFPLLFSFFVFIVTSLGLNAVAIETMTLEEKVGQLLMVHYMGEEVGQDARLLVQKAHVGGIIYFRAANGLTSPEQVKRLSDGLQGLARIPLFIAIDQEGGAITHLKQGFTLFPSNWAVGRTGEPEYAKRVAVAIAQQLKAVGINMNLAPVVDVNTNPENPVIGIRSFGTSPQQVATFAKASLEGYKEQGIIATLKHFPGHGDVTVDSHKGLPVVDKSVTELEAVELYPFMKLAHDAEVIMTAHLLVPSLDPDMCATFSAPILQGLLRQKLGFTGIIVSDSLLMDGALSQASGVAEAAIKAFNAGCDLLMIAGGFSKESLGTADSMYKVHQALVQAVLDGRIATSRVDESVARILKRKAAYPLTFSTTDMPDSKELSQDVAKRSVQLLYNNMKPDFKPKSLVVVAPKLLSFEVEQTRMAKNKTIYYKTLQPSQDEINRVLESAETADSIVVLTANAWKFSNQIELIKQIQKRNKNVVLLCVGTTLDAEVIPSCSSAVASFGPTPASLDAAFELLKL